jgi:hypothetical protein
MTTGPESRRQAIRWQRHKGRYLATLGCHTCAAQAAYGHQHGFSVIHPPCDSCRTKVATLPVPAVNGWRKLRDEPATASATTANAVAGSSDPEEPRRSLTTEGEAA